MTYLAHTAHLQLASLASGTIGWILSLILTGIVQWREWDVANTTVITSGVAWVGIWRVCFFSDILVSSESRVMYCQRIGVLDSFVPPEIFAAQGLTIVAVIFVGMGKMTTIFALRKVYFGTEVEQWSQVYALFLIGGILYLISSVCILVPVVWNLHSVMTNQSIAFPQEFYMPSAPQTQQVGTALPLGIISCFLLLITGIFLVRYRLPSTSHAKVHPESRDHDEHDAGVSGTLSRETFSSMSSVLFSSVDQTSNSHLGIDNEAYEFDDKL
ncbi:claudin-34 [Protopterus annectens]|uniref:claudin-34 n=1 Tax=Protopterus annectens TaxID=7888 RepID=UPI001CF94275|nr:claudin-34 [Protopterus annectens]